MIRMSNITQATSTVAEADDESTTELTEQSTEGGVARWYSFGAAYRLAVGQGFFFRPALYNAFSGSCLFM